MPLIKIDNQPYFSNPRPTDCFSCDERVYMHPAMPGDPIFMQFKQTPCNPSLVCDGDFSALTDNVEAICDTQFNDLGTEELINGTFTNDADDWVLGNDCVFTVDHIHVNAGSKNTFYQWLQNGFLPQYAIYKIVFTVSNWGGSGTLTPAFLGNSPDIYPGTAITGNGTFTQYIKIGLANKFGLAITSDWDGDVDDVSVKRIAACWDFGPDETEGWRLSSLGYAETFGAGCTGAPLTCPGVLSPNTDYQITIVFEAGSTGIFGYNLGGNLTTTFIAAPGTVVINATSGAGTDFSTYHPLGFCGTISSISVLELSGECWDFEAGHWIEGTNSLCHIPGTTDQLTNATTFLSGKYYQVKFTVSGRTQGTFNFGMSGLLYSYDINQTPYANGNYVAYFTPNANGQLVFYTSASFDGCFSNVEVFELRNDYPFELREYNPQDLNGNFVLFLNEVAGVVDYFEDYVTVKFSFDQANIDVPYGCYRVHTYDVCEIQFEEIIKDGEFLNPINFYWVDSSGGNTSIVGGRLQEDLTNAFAFIVIPNYYRGNDGSGYQDNPAVPLGTHNYRITFDIIQNDDPSNISVGIFGGGQIGAAYQSTVGTHTVDYAFDPEYNVPPRQWFAVVFRYLNTSTGIIKIDNVSVRRIEPFDTTFYSEPIKYAANFECTKLIAADCDTDNFDFKFNKGNPQTNTIFQIAQRVYLRAVNPDYPQDSSDYLYSEGTKSRLSAQSEKSFNMLTGAINETAHDAMRIQLSCQNFFIGDDVATSERWYQLPGDYNPDWNKNAESALAIGRFEIQKKIKGAKFFRNS